MTVIESVLLPLILAVWYLLSIILALVNGYHSGQRVTIYYTLLTERSRLAFGPVDQPKALLGDEVKLECRADFNPILDLVYLWYHNDRCKCI